MIINLYIYQNNHCCRKVSVQQGKVKNDSFTREGDVRVETKSAEHPQLITLSCNKLLSLCKLYHHSSSASLSYAAFYFNSMYKSLFLSFDSNISESRVSGTEVSACVDKVVTHPTQSDTQQFYPHIQPTQSI